MTTHDDGNVPVRAELRASDRDRERVAELLREHCAEGRLTADELDDRLEQAYGARKLGELDAVLRDLPVSSGPVPEHREPVLEPSGRPARHRGAGFGWPVAPGLVLLTVLVAAVAAASGGEGLWLLWPLGFLWLKGGWGRHRKLPEGRHDRDEPVPRTGVG